MASRILIVLTPVTSAGCAVSSVSTSLTEVSVVDNEDSYSRLQTYRYVAVNKEFLTLDIARGGGDYLSSMAYLQSCPESVHQLYAEIMQQEFNQIASGFPLDVEDLLQDLKQALYD